MAMTWMIFFTVCASLAAFEACAADEMFNSNRVEDQGPTVFSNNNVNLGNLANLGLHVDREDRGPELSGPNVCTNQEP